MAGGFLVQHGVINIHQTMNVMLVKLSNQLLRFWHRQWISREHFFCMIIIQISAITANCRCIQRQCLIKRVDGDMMPTGDDDELMSCRFCAGQRFNG
jgi:hypothetical protein